MLALAWPNWWTVKPSVVSTSRGDPARASRPAQRCVMIDHGGCGMRRPAARRVPVAAAVIVVDGRLLLVRRRIAEGALVWRFPAGKVEPGESAADAANGRMAQPASLARQRC